jgi:hypothetical protein
MAHHQIGLLVLLACLAALNVMDVIVTNMVIAKGRGSEANPVMAFLMTKLGKFWWVYKAVLLPLAYEAWVYLPVNPVPDLIAVFLVTALYVYVIINNYTVLWRK